MSDAELSPWFVAALREALVRRITRLLRDKDAEMSETGHYLLWLCRRAAERGAWP